jgi:hypothetical protein
MDNEVKLIKDIGKNGVWLNSRYGDIQRKFGNKFVAVSKEHIIAADRDFNDVLKEVKAQGINPGSVVIEFIPETGTVLIL